MKTFYLLAIIAIVGSTLMTGCQTKSGSREYIPGRGWVPTR